jgi:DNA modification methylase
MTTPAAVFARRADWAVLTGDVFATLPTLPAKSVHCCVTSPPYWGLRDYGTGTWDGGDPECGHVKTPTSVYAARPASRDGRREPDPIAYRDVCGKCGAVRVDMQLGSEPSPDCRTDGQAQCGACFVCNMVRVFREVRRVLRDDGTCWVNLGDSYTGGGRNSGRPAGFVSKQDTNVGAMHDIPAYQGMAAGNLVGVPWRVALALQADGWVLRQDVIWAKKSPMPESVTSRCTKAHEYVFLLTKSMRYFYDAEAIKEKLVGVPHAPKNKKLDKSRNDQGEMEKVWGADGRANKRSVWAADDHRELLDWLAENNPDELARFMAAARNKPDVWRLSSQGYPGAHFATFPPKLILPMILAGTSERGVCPHCAAPWVRLVEKDRQPTRPGENTKITARGREAPTRGTSGEYSDDGRAQFRSAAEVGNRDPERHVTRTVTTGWQAGCDCPDNTPVPAVVLDPFAGSGTTLAVAVDRGRRALGTELNPEYVKLIAARMAAVDPGLF